MPDTPRPAAGATSTMAVLAALGLASVLILGILGALVRAAMAEPLVPDARLVARVSVPPGSSGVPLMLRGTWDRSSGVATPREGAAAEVPLPPGPWDALAVRILGDPSARWRLEWRDGHARTMWPSVEPGARLDLSGIASDPESTGPIILRISPAPGAPPAALNYIDLRARAVAINRVPDAGGAILLALVPWALTLVLVLGRGLELRRAGVIGVGIGGSLAALVALNPALLEHARGVALILCMAPLAVLARQFAAGTQSLDGAKAFVLPLCLFALAFAARWDALRDLRTLELRPDALGYALIAREGTFYRTEQPWGPFVREPLFPAILRTAYTVLPPTAPSARLAGALVSSLVPVVAWLVGRRLLHPAAAALAAGALAAHPALAALGAEALRNDAITLAFLLLALARLHLAARPIWRAAAFGALGAAMVLLQVTLISFFALVALFEAVSRRWKPVEWFVLVLPIVILLPGHLRFNKERFGSWTYSADIHVRFYANREFAGRPGWPDPSRLATDPYAGGPMPVASFLAELGPGGLASRFAGGLAAHLATGMPRQVLLPWSAWLLLPALLGALWWATRRELTWFAAWNLLFIAPVALVAGAGGDWRLASTIAPWWVMLWCGGLQGGWELARGVRH